MRAHKPIPDRIESVIVPDSEGFWLVDFPQLPGLHTFGETLKEARSNAKKAFREWIRQHELAGVHVRVR